MTQNPSAPVDSRVGLAIMALTVFLARGESGSWEVSKKAYPPWSLPSLASFLGPPTQKLSLPLLGRHLKAESARLRHPHRSMSADVAPKSQSPSPPDAEDDDDDEEEEEDSWRRWRDSGSFGKKMVAVVSNMQSWEKKNGWEKKKIREMCVRA